MSEPVHPIFVCGRFGLFARLDAIEDYFDAAFTFAYVPRYYTFRGRNR